VPEGDNDGANNFCNDDNDGRRARLAATTDGDDKGKVWSKEEKGGRKRQ